MGVLDSLPNLVDIKLLSGKKTQGLAQSRKKGGRTGNLPLKEDLLGNPPGNHP